MKSKPICNMCMQYLKPGCNGNDDPTNDCCTPRTCFNCGEVTLEANCMNGTACHNLKNWKPLKITVGLCTICKEPAPDIKIYNKSETEFRVCSAECLHKVFKKEIITSMVLRNYCKRDSIDIPVREGMTISLPSSFNWKPIAIPYSVNFKAGGNK